MTDMFLSALVSTLVRESADSMVQRVGEMWGIDDQRERLHEKLLVVQAVLTDAEEQGEANPAVKSWLVKLRSAAYDADDVLDEFHYEELRRNAMKHGHKVRNVSGFFSIENPVVYRYKMSRKLKKVVVRIDELVTNMDRFKFVQSRQGRVAYRVGTHSYVIESEVVGRGEDKEKIVKLLTEMCPTENFMVLPVVGMGGLGKTTLAQLVYNDPRVQEHFKLFIWVCVSDEFDVGALTKLIIDCVIEGDCNVPINNMELLQRRLRHEISRKKYLLVLDDVWNENVEQWEQLRALLNCGDLGSALLVTTRSGRVASIMGTMPSYNLGYMGNEESWSLFRKRAFGMGVRECEEFVEIGRKLVQKFRGLPLAIKTLGSLMSYKHEVREWLVVLEQSTLWENKHANDGVWSVLRVSYNHLPSYMKQCFAFCAVFPKDYVMEKEKLVQYWMAHGYIPSDEPGDLEMRGNDIFNELVWRSFFQDVEQVIASNVFTSKQQYCSGTTCKMHDLMHDLAQSVLRDECLFMDGFSTMKYTRQCNVRHISLEGPIAIDEAIKCCPVARSLLSCKKVRTSIHTNKIGFVKSNFLRVLDLSGGHIAKSIVVLPGKMKHLRYLHLSFLEMQSLPEAITTLYLLQTLRLFQCSHLSKLPEGMRYMVNLRHLYIEKCFGLKCMPPGLGELKYLQILTYYIVGTGIGNRIGDLKTINLHGKLEMYNLSELRDARDAKEVSMASKQNLDHLALCWGMPKKSLHNYSKVARSNGSEAVVVDHFDPFEVLDALKPCNKLKFLRIQEYKGEKFPIWMTECQMLKNLVELYIIKCKSRTYVAPMHMLPLLQILHIKFAENLRHLCCGIFVAAESSDDAFLTFPSLKSLILHEMPNLRYWCEGEVREQTSLTFPVLSELSIIDCPKLSAMPEAPSLKNLSIIGNTIMSCLAAKLTTVCNLTLERNGGKSNNADETLFFKPWESLECLSIKGFNHITSPTDVREDEELTFVVNTTAVRELTMLSNFWFSPIPSNSPLWLWKSFKFLEVLHIYGCDSLIYWPEVELSNLINLSRLEVVECKKFLGSLLEPLSEMMTRQVLLPKLEKLDIRGCPNMVEVPNLRLPEYGSSVGLKNIAIFNCESLNFVPPSIGGLTTLEHFMISGSKKLESLPEELGSLVVLKKLYINSCENLNSLPEQLGSLVALKKLLISSCENLNSLPSSIRCLTALEVLKISSCKNLASLPEGMQGLEALKSLQITWCPKIRILPEGLLHRLRSLDCLEITWCPLLQRDFRKNGKYWYLISEIPELCTEDEGRSSKIGDLTRLISSCKIPCLSAQS